MTYSNDANLIEIEELEFNPRFPEEYGIRLFGSKSCLEIWSEGLKEVLVGNECFDELRMFFDAEGIEFPELDSPFWERLIMECKRCYLQHLRPHNPDMTQ